MRHGLKLLKPMASSFTPCLDGRYLLLGLNDQRDHLEISKFSRLDADAYPRCYIITHFRDCYFYISISHIIWFFNFEIPFE